MRAPCDMDMQRVRVGKSYAQLIHSSHINWIFALSCISASSDARFQILEYEAID